MAHFLRAFLCSSGRNKASDTAFDKSSGYPEFYIHKIPPSKGNNSNRGPGTEHRFHNHSGTGPIHKGQNFQDPLRGIIGESNN